MGPQRETLTLKTEASRLLDLVTRRLTAPMRMLPTVFLLGATRAGSTTLTELLWRHPACVQPLTKELMYLQQLPGVRFKWNYQLSWVMARLWGGSSNGQARYSLTGYRKFFPLTREAEKRRGAIGHAFTTDCDPFNLYCPVAMRRIQSFADRPKFIISFRDPIERAYSDYQMHRRRAGEFRSFEECVRDEVSGRETRFRKRFLNQSSYAPHVRRWLTAYARETFLFIRAEDLFVDGHSVARALYEFLELQPVDGEVQARNSATYDAPLSERMRDELREYFRPYNEELYNLIGRALW